MKNFINFALCSIFLLFHSTAFSQSSNTEEDNAIKSTNFSLPSSIAFNLLEVNPSKIYRPGFAKDFKFDWVIKDNKISSNIAIETQPIWLFGYSNTDYNKLSKHNYFEKLLSSISVSIGTSSKDSIRSLAWGVKLNLYADKNPIYDENYIKEIGNFIADKKIIDKMDSLELLYDSEIDEVKKEKYLVDLVIIKKAYAKIEKKYFNDIDKYKEQYEKDNWNSTIIDLGFGQLFNYLSDSFDSLSFQSQGGSAWLSGNIGIGRNVLINAMIMYSDLSGNQIATIGANIRYGSLKANFFIEGLYNSSSDDNLKKIFIAYGGELKIINSIALQFGLRTEYTKNFNLKKLIPIINVNYLL